METRLSDEHIPLLEFPARHRREPQLYILEPTSSRMKGSVDADHRSASRNFVLPEGWTVEEIQRRNSSHIDKTYLSNAGNGTAASVSKQRRTHVVKKNHRSATVSKVHSKQVPRLSIWNGTRFETVVIDPQPPKTVKWVFNGPEGNKFSAHVNGSDVSTSVKQTWSETFVSLIQDRY
ncbi:hypothetical protein HA466_0312860 [Hirschfeldia incana]|nr:hypothetical protein HA466_0312860 [Hirschfeldia incana]